MKIGFLGQGAMGSRMAAQLVAAGHEVTAWNRTWRPGLVTTPTKAVAGAEVVIASLRDDAASAATWAAALPAMAPGTVAIDCSTIGPGAAQALHAAAAAQGIAFLDAPVAGSRPQAEAGALIFLVGGAADVLAQVEPLLLTMGAAVHLAGGPGAGATVKLVVNSLFAAQVAALAELFGLAQALQLDLARMVEIVGATPVASPAAKGAAAAMLAGNFAPAFPIDLVAKDLGLALASPAQLPVTQTVAASFQEAIAKGLAADNITGIVQLYLRR